MPPKVIRFAITILNSHDYRVLCFQNTPENAYDTREEAETVLDKYRLNGLHGLSKVWGKEALSTLAVTPVNCWATTLEPTSPKFINE